MTGRPGTDKKTLAADRAALLARLDEAHVAPLVAFADRLAGERGLPAGAVPYPDPDGAGVRARVLFLLNDPGRGALESSGGTGLLSLRNADQTTYKQVRAIRDSGFDPRDALYWNGIPGPVRAEERNAQVAPASLALLSLLELLDDLRGVVMLGEYAHKVWVAVNARTDRFRGLAHVRSKHPARSSNADLLAAYRKARDIAAIR
jgi:hypothetical protein